MFFLNFPGAINDHPNGRCMTGCPTYFYMFICSQKKQVSISTSRSICPTKIQTWTRQYGTHDFSHAGIVTVVFEKQIINSKSHKSHPNDDNHHHRGYLTSQSTMASLNKSHHIRQESLHGFFYRGHPGESEGS